MASPEHGSFNLDQSYSHKVLNVQRQAYCVFMFLAAVSLFGTLISQLNEILASSGTFTRQLHRNFEAYLELRPRNGSFDLFA